MLDASAFLRFGAHSARRRRLLQQIAPPSPFFCPNVVLGGYAQAFRYQREDAAMIRVLISPAKQHVTFFKRIRTRRAFRLATTFGQKIGVERAICCKLVWRAKHNPRIRHAGALRRRRQPARSKIRTIPEQDPETRPRPRMYTFLQTYSAPEFSRPGVSILLVTRTLLHDATRPS